MIPHLALLEQNSLLQLALSIHLRADRLVQARMAQTTQAGILGRALPAHARPVGGRRAELLQDIPMNRPQFLCIRVIVFFHEKLLWRLGSLFRVLFPLGGLEHLL